MNNRNAIKEQLNALVATIKTRNEMVVTPAIPSNQAEKKIQIALHEYWVKHDFYTVEEIENQFRIPPQFSVFLANYSQFYEKKGSRSLKNAEGIIVDTTRYWYSYFSTYKDQYKTEGKYPPMLLHIGGWSDKHWYFISCQKDNHFGKVFECYDTDFFDLPHVYEAQWNDFFTMLDSEFK